MNVFEKLSFSAYYFAVFYRCISRVFRTKYLSLAIRRIFLCRELFYFVTLLGFSVVMINKTNGEDSTSVVKCSFVQLFCIDDSVKMKQLLDVERNE